MNESEFLDRERSLQRQVTAAVELVGSAQQQLSRLRGDLLALRREHRAASRPLTQAQAYALVWLHRHGELRCHEGVSYSTVLALSRLGLVTVEMKVTGRGTRRWRAVPVERMEGEC